MPTATVRYVLRVADLAGVVYSSGRCSMACLQADSIPRTFSALGVLTGSCRADLALLEDLRDAAQFLIEHVGHKIDSAPLRTVNATITRSCALHPGQLRTQSQAIGVPTTYGRHNPRCPHRCPITGHDRRKFFAQVGPRMGRLTTDKVVADIDVFHQTLRGLDAVVGDRVGTVGYCMGARLVTRYAGSHPDNVVAAAGFHGGGLVTKEPDSPHLSIATARAEFVYGHADNDGSMPPEAVQTLGAALASAGLTATNEIYPDAPHGYSMADTSMYQESGVERSFTQLEALFSSTLR